MVDLEEKTILDVCHFSILMFSHEKQLFSILAYEKFGQIWSIFILLVTMATVHANQILTIFMLLLSGHYHCVKVSSDSETVRGMGLWEFSGALRELMFSCQKTSILTSKFDILHLNSFHNVYAFIQ